MVINMKKCNYCGKEISYFEQYCSDACQERGNKFYETRERYTGFFSVCCAVFVMMIPVGIFLFSIIKGIGTIMVVGGSLALALLVFFLPFPTEGMLSKFKIQKSVKITRIVSGFVFLFGIAFAIFSLLF